ncbi:hypothetical protein AB6H26_18125 [Providencia hangzhouensis]
MAVGEGGDNRDPEVMGMGIWCAEWILWMQSSGSQLTSLSRIGNGRGG